MPARPKKNHRSQKNQLGSFRIIAGEWRSRRLEFPVVDGLRPTTDRVRETVFNWLAHDLPGSKVLDLFSGSGSLGVEALSRGADELTAVERDRHVAQAIKTNLDMLGGSARSTVINADALQWLSSANLDQIDMLFLDPPFRTELLDQTLALLSSKEMKQGALVYLEVEKEKQSLHVPQSWQLEKEKQAGQVSYRLYAVTGASE